MRTTPDTLEDFLDQIFIVVVLYARKADASEAMQSLSSFRLRKHSILVYDNSAMANPINDPEIIYRHDPANGGVSKGYNEAYKLACARGKEWLLLLDQDTSFTSPYFQSLFRAVHEHPGSVVFVPELRDQSGPVSPFRWIARRGKRITSSPKKMDLKKYRFLNSGALIARRAFADAGMYDERIPLDFSDIAFGEALRKVTDHFVRVDAVLRHGLSATENIPEADALVRFRYFCAASKTMGELFGSRLLYSVNAMLRCVRLSLKFRSMAFVRVFFGNNLW